MDASGSRKGKVGRRGMGMIGSGGCPPERSRAKEGVWVTLGVRAINERPIVLVPGKKHPNIEVVRRRLGQFSPKLPLPTGHTGLQSMSYCIYMYWNN